MTAAVAESSRKGWVVRMDSRGRITLPKEVRSRLAIKSGDRLVMTEESGGLRIEPARVRVSPAQGEK